MNNFDLVVNTLCGSPKISTDEATILTSFLQAKGLITPDLPEPIKPHLTRREWQLYPGATTGVISRVSAGYVWLYANKQDLSPDEARTLAYALLAAADFAETEEA